MFCLGMKYIHIEYKNTIYFLTLEYFTQILNKIMNTLLQIISLRHNLKLNI